MKSVKSPQQDVPFSNEPAAPLYGIWLKDGSRYDWFSPNGITFYTYDRRVAEMQLYHCLLYYKEASVREFPTQENKKESEG